MSLLDEKIKKCEDFLRKFSTYRLMDAEDIVMNHDMEEPFWGLSEVMFRAKIAMVVKFFEEMGNIIESETLEKMNPTVDEEWSFPDDELICALGSLADPFLKVVSLNRFSNKANNVCGMVSGDVLECFEAVDYADNEAIVPKEMQEKIKDKEGEINFDLLDDDNSLKNIATGAVNDAQCDNYLFYFAEWDRLLPYFAKKYVMKILKSHGANFSPFYDLAESAGEDAKKVWNLDREAGLTFANHSECYDLFQLDVNPMEVYVTAFGEMQGWAGYPFDITKTDVAYPVLKALQHLYLFKCDRQTHFLPPEYVHGDELIFPNFKM